MRFALENKETLEQDFVARRNAEMVSENVVRMVGLTADHRLDWRVYYELVRPVSEDEKHHVFNYAAERTRVIGDHLLDRNRDGRI